MKSLRPKIPARIVTRRLLLRPVRLVDARPLNRAIVESFAELKPWMPWAARRPPTLKQTIDYCRQAATELKARHEFRMVVFRRTDDELLGCAGLVRGDLTVPKFEIGYWIRTQHRGQGYVTEAVKALTRFARRHLRVRRLEIRTDARNRRSAAVAKRTSFVLEGRLRQDGRDNCHQLRDTLVFARTF